MPLSIHAIQASMEAKENPPGAFRRKAWRGLLRAMWPFFSPSVEWEQEVNGAIGERCEPADPMAGFPALHDANLMRVTRGAGKPYEIGRQAQDFITALIEYRDAVGHFPPSDELTSLLTVERDPEVMARMNDDNLAQIYAEQEIIRGSLQIVASRLVGQSTQETAGSHEMLGGMNSLIAVRAERQKKWATAKPAAQRRSKQAALKSPRSTVRKPEA